MICIFTGMLLVFYFAPKPKENECFLPGKIFVAFPQKQMSGIIPHPGRKVHFAKTSADKGACVLKNLSAVIVQKEPFVVTAFSAKSVEHLSELSRLKEGEQWTLLTDSHALANCIETKIQYGYVR